MNKSRNEREGKYAGKRSGMHFRSSRWRRTYEYALPLKRPSFYGFWIGVDLAATPIN